MVSIRARYLEAGILLRCYAPPTVLNLIDSKTEVTIMFNFFLLKYLRSRNFLLEKNDLAFFYQFDVWLELFWRSSALTRSGFQAPTD